MNRVPYEKMRVTWRIASAFAGLTIFLSLFILFTSLWIFKSPVARVHIQRLSWKLFLVIMGIQVIWATLYLIAYADPDLAAMVGSTKIGCSALMVILTGCRMMVSWIIACIAVNLALSVRWNVNSARRGLVRWYILGSGILGFLPTFVAAARGHYAGGSAYNTCYFARITPYNAYVIRVFVAYHLWLIIATAIALIAVIISLTSIFTQSRKTSKLLQRAARQSHMALQQPLEPIPRSSLGPDPSKAKEEIIWNKEYTPTNAKRPRLSRNTSSKRLSMNALDDAFLRIALRVSVYPLVAVAVNVIYITTDLFFYLYPVDLPDSYDALFMVGIIIYAGRGAVFAIIAILIDPCFRSGLKTAWTEHKKAQLVKKLYPNGRSSILPESIHPSNPIDTDSTACSFWDMIHSDPSSPNGLKSGSTMVSSIQLMSPPFSPSIHQTLVVIPQIREGDISDYGRLGKGEEGEYNSEDGSLESMEGKSEVQVDTVSNTRRGDEHQHVGIGTRVGVESESEERELVRYNSKVDL